MIIVCYDFSDDKKRKNFSDFLKSYGRKIQYSIYEIKNSQRVLRNVLKEIELRYEKTFEGSESVLIFQTCGTCNKNIVRYGSACNEEKEVVFF